MAQWYSSYVCWVTTQCHLMITRINVLLSACTLLLTLPWRCPRASAGTTGTWQSHKTENMLQKKSENIVQQLFITGDLCQAHLHMLWNTGDQCHAHLHLLWNTGDLCQAHLHLLWNTGDLCQAHLHLLWNTGVIEYRWPMSGSFTPVMEYRCYRIQVTNVRLIYTCIP